MILLEIPTETFSKVRFKGFVLAWSPPEDCSTITGKLLAKIIITGVSEAVKNFNVTRKTSMDDLNVSKILHGAEDYVARIYVIRSWKSAYNESVVRRFPFTTPPKGFRNFANISSKPGMTLNDRDYFP